MSLDADQIVDRRRMRRKLTFWRVLAVLLAAAAVITVGSALRTQDGVDMLGAGGGSIARIDDAGMLRVGPESAGARPGPICYGRGGTEPTIDRKSVV